MYKIEIYETVILIILTDYVTITHKRKYEYGKY